MNRWLAKSSIRTKAIAIVVAVITVTLTITTTAIVMRTNRLITEVERNHADSLTRNFAEACELPLAVGDKIELSHLIQKFVKNEHAVFVAVYDKAGREMASHVRNQSAWDTFDRTGRETEAFFVGNGVVELTANREELGFLEQNDESSEQGPDRIVGRVVVGTCTAHVRALQRKQMLTALAMAALTTAVSVVLVFYADRGVIRRLGLLVQACKRISQGDFTQPIRETSNDEVGQLARAYEEMRQAIHRRTTELTQANEQIRQAQADLVQSEKMSMLGQLVAGVAHEINTPTGAILNVSVDALEHLKQLVALNMATGELPAETRTWAADMLALVLEDGRIPSESTIRKGRREIEKRLRQVGVGDSRRMAEVIAACGLTADDCDERLIGHLSCEPVLSLFEHALALKTSSEISATSAKKIARIVRALRFYSREGNGERVEIDVNESIENALMILKNRIKHIAEVKIDLEESLPPALFGPELSQVWTNILNNACDAIEGSQKEWTGLIEITTKTEAGRVIVRISDDGPPIPEQTMRRMYDPFFTSKPVGMGTGLGLSICTGIMQRFGGTISARNEPGHVVFEVSLPVKASDQEAEERTGQVVAEQTSTFSGLTV